MSISHYSVLILAIAPQDRSLYCRYLSQDTIATYNVVEIETGSAAISYLAENQPDLILLDNQLSDIDGWEFLQQLKSQFPDWEIPVIMLVTQEDEKDAVRAIKTGAWDYLVKENLTCVRFCHTVDATLEKSRLKQKLRMQEQQQQASERRFRAIFDQSFQLTGLLTTEGILLEANQTALNFGGVKLEDIINRPFWEIYCWTISPTTQERLKQAIASAAQGDRIRYEVDVLGAGGRKVTVDFSLLPLKDESGQVVMLIAEARDISEAKQNELIRQQTEKALQENQILLQVIMDSLPMAIFWKDRNSRFLGCNRQLLLDAGLSLAAQIIGKTDFDLPWREQAPLYQADDRIVIESGQPKFNIEQPLTTGDNRTIWLSINKIPLYKPDGEIVGVLASYEDITERKQIEQALQESERRYATLAASAPVGIFRTDVEGNCLYVSEHWCQIAGLTPEAASGYGWVNALHPEDRDMVAAQWYHCAQTGEVFSLEYRFLRPDGVETWVFGQAVQEKNLDGKVVGYVGTITNITTRKQTEEALRRSEQLYRTLLNNFPNGAVVLFDHDLRYLLVGGLGLASVGLNKANMEGKTLWEIFPPEVCEMVAPQCQQALAGESVIGEVPFSDRHYITHHIPVRDEQDHVIAGIILTQDISERKKAEQERDRLLQILAAQNQTLEAQVSERTLELEQSKERFRNLVETSSDWVWEVNEIGVYTYSSPQITNLLGYSPEEVLGKTPFDLMPPEEARIILQKFREFVYLQAPFQCLENINIHKNGRLITLETSAVPIFDTQGRFRGYRGMDRDITVRKQAEAALRENEARFQRIAANVPGVMYQYILHADGSQEFIYISDRCRELLELEPATIMENADAIFALIHPDDIPSLQESITHSANSLQQFSWEARMITPSGRLKWIQGISQPERQAEGDILWDGLILDISERKQTEIALNNLSDRLNLAIKSAQIGIWDWDIINNHLVWDERMYQLYGIKAADFTGAYQAWEAGLHPDDLLSVRAAMEQAIAGEKDFEPEFRVVWTDGTIRFLKAYALVQRDAQGQAQRMIGINFDISDRRREELENKRLKERLEFVLSANPAVIYTCQVLESFAATFISKNVQNVLGYTPQEWLSHPDFWTDRIHPEDLPQVLVELSHLEKREYHLYQYRFLHKDGSYRWIKDEYRLVRDQVGKPVEIIGYVVDISEQQAALRERELAQEAMRLSEERLLLALEASGDGLWDWNITTNELYLSPQWLRMLGFEVSELPSDFSTWEKLVHPEDQPYMLEKLNAHLQDASVPYKLDYRVQTKAGDYRWIVNYGKAVVRDEDGNPLRMTGTHRDISEAKKAESELRQANEKLAISNHELARATRLKDEFLATISHELRTPLNAILGISEGLQDQVFGAINEKQGLALQTIERSGKHLLELINDILDLSKIEAGQMDLQYNHVAISPLCQSSLAFIKQEAFQKRIQLEVKIQPHLPELLVDERRIRQVLINLLNNAVKFTPEGGKVTLKVTRESIAPQAQTTSCQDIIRIAVIDTGIGIAQENLKKLFQPFIQIDSAFNRQYNGTGLGLALVKRLVEMHGGTVEVSSQLGVGSCFTVDLPSTNVCEFSSESVKQVSPELNFTVSETVEHSPLILLAEDNEANVFTISGYLETIGYRVILAKNGQEAIALTKFHFPDLILMDIQMPVLDGLEAIKQIRLDQNFTKVPIIALTAFAMPGDKENCLAVGANDYLPKPVKLKQLTNIIKKFLVNK
ncbi:PAS domain S-box protein [Anabaena azotica]|uniref:histidine kinase n=1 Tax=Anabaena azotica FACHB-119 TaxID=947527 RepID=A0ABR8DAD9_9NOST|nr:PAS domain S-box protein [Anabaena azotica]MBD2503106.1 PAS domain S-box protein [Anabaena azotica FACHB-119]